MSGLAIPSAVCGRGVRRMICILILSFVHGAPATGQSLGKLFSTPNERALLDELRANRDLVVAEPEPVVEAAAPEPVVERLTIDGLVVRSSGANAAWVNGQPVFDGWTTREGVRVDTASVGKSGRVKITLPSGVGTIDLKPGQKIDVDSGVVVEGYQPQRLVEEGDSAFGAPNAEAPDDEQAAGASAPAGAVPAPPPPSGQATTPDEFVEQLRKALGGG